MKVWIITKNGVAEDSVPVSLKEACEIAGVNYRTAAETGKRMWAKPGMVIQLTQAEVIKMKPRGGGIKNFAKNKQQSIS